MLNQPAYRSGVTLLRRGLGGGLEGGDEGRAPGVTLKAGACGAVIVLGFLRAIREALFDGIDTLELNPHGWPPTAQMRGWYRR